MQSVAQQVAMDGYAIIRRHSPNAPAIDAFQELGDIDNSDDLIAIQSLIPREAKEAKENTYSGIFGAAEFPLHSDLAHWAHPPRYVALRCINGFSGVETLLLDGLHLIAEIGADALRMALVQPRRRMSNGKQILRVLDQAQSSQDFVLRWDSVFLEPATALSARICSEAMSVLKKTARSEISLLDAGDTLILDNWRFLHGRSGVSIENRQRHIERAYLRTLA